MWNYISYELLLSVLNMSITASVVILFVLLARLLLRRAPKVFSYALWSVVLFRLLCPISIQADFSLLGLVDPPARTAAPYATAVEYVPPDLVHTPQPQVQLPVEAANQAINQALPQGEEQTVADPLEAPVAIATCVWLLGVLALALYSVAAYTATRRRLIGAVPLRDNIYLADHIPSPFVMGIFRPKIYLPSALSAREQAYIIRHEQHHIRRGDHIVKLLSFAALCIHWFNPLVWAAFILSGKDMEMSCDEAVVKSLGAEIRADYSASLLSLATGRRIIAGMPLAFGEGDPKGRIRNLARWRSPKRWAVLLAALACIAAAGACAANPPQPAGGVSGQYASMEDFAQQTMDAAKTVTYFQAPNGGEATAQVTGTKLAWLDKQGELSDLAPDGTLEVWAFHYLVQVDVDPSQIVLAGGMYEEDGWYDLEGQGGHNVVALRYEDGSYDILYDQVVNDNMYFYGYHASPEEALYDWYVADQGLDLPLIIKDLAVGESPVPARRYDGEGWYFYLPVEWDQPFRNSGGVFECYSPYGTASTLLLAGSDSSENSVEVVKDRLAAQGRTITAPEAGSARYAAAYTDGLQHDVAYLFPSEDGGCFALYTIWYEDLVASYPQEVEILTAIAASFTVDSRIEPAPVQDILAMQSVLRRLTLENHTPMGTSGDGEAALAWSGEAVQVLQAAADRLTPLSDPAGFPALDGGICLYLDGQAGRTLRLSAGEEPFQSLLEYTRDGLQEAAVADDPQLYTLLLACREGGGAELHDLDGDGFLEALVWLAGVRGLVILDDYGGLPQRLDVNQALGASSSDYSGLIGNIREGFGNLIQATLDGETGLYSYADGQLTYLCPLSEALG